MSETVDIHNYDDIIDLPHYFPPDRVRMPRQQRAAQFMPFSALKGYDAALDNVQREIESEFGDR